MILGLNYSGLHDSSIALLDDKGAVKFAASEERYSRVKKDGRFPRGCLAQVSLDKVSHVAIPYLAEPAQAKSADTFFADVLLECKPPAVPASYPPEWRRRLEALGRPLIFVDHHLAHAATAFFLSGQSEALILTSDYSAHHCAWNMGLYRAGPEGIVPLHLASHAHYYPLCSLYSQVTALLGFRPNIHEGKITGLAAHGKHRPECEKKLWALHREISESSVPLYEWVGWLGEATASSLEVNPALAAMFRERLTDYSDAEVACAVQRLTERRVTTLLRRALELYPSATVLLAGGLFANVKINLEVKRLGIKHLFVCPPMGDEGIALGATVLARAQLGLSGLRGSPLRDLFWGSTPAANTSQTLDELELKYKRPRDLPQEVAKLLAEGKTIALVQGRMEFGPRALGHRSILYQATDPTVNDWLNKKLHRTEFMPFAPIVRAEAAPDLFDNEELAGAEHTAEFMTICFSCRDSFRKSCPAVVHVDGTARPQLVRADTQPDLHAILTAYEKLTGLPALINTSFNVHDEPIVGSVRDAVVAFFQSELDYLVLDDFLLTRTDNPSWMAATTALTSTALREEKSWRKAITTAYGKRALEQQTWVKELTDGTAWLEQQNAKLKGWVEELERARDWLVKQRATWQHAADEREKIVQEQRAWARSLEEATRWLEKQRAEWQRAAEDREKLLQQQARRIEECNEGLHWLEEQRAIWQRQAENHAQLLKEQTAWIENRNEAVHWLEQQCTEWQRLVESRDRLFQERSAQIEGRDQLLKEQAAWIENRNEAVRWLEKQRGGWQRGIQARDQLLKEQTAWIENREKLLREQAAWIENREKALKDQAAWIENRNEAVQWLEQQRTEWEKLAADRNATIQEQEKVLAELQKKAALLEQRLAVHPLKRWLRRLP